MRHSLGEKSKAAIANLIVQRNEIDGRIQSYLGIIVEGKGLVGDVKLDYKTLELITEDPKAVVVPTDDMPGPEEDTGEPDKAKELAPAQEEKTKDPKPKELKPPKEI